MSVGPTVFYKHIDGTLMLIVAKIVDDIKAADAGDYAHLFIEALNEKFKLGTVKSGPGKMRFFFGINTNQESDMTIQTDRDDKLNALTEYYLSRPRRKQSSIPINEMEKS